jgi:hypothetical protein
MKKIILLISIFTYSQVCVAGNSGGFASKVSFKFQPESLTFKTSKYAVRVVEVQNDGLKVKIGINGQIRKTFISFDSLENAKIELIEALTTSASAGGEWVEL